MQENKPITPRTVRLSTAMDMPISLGAFEYIAGIDPKETWLPVTGENIDDKAMQEIRKKHGEQIKNAELTKEFGEKMEDFVNESLRLFKALMAGDMDIIRAYTGGKKYHFILGMPRTGGTTIYTGLSQAYGWPWDDMLLSMTHNLMPNAVFVQQNPHSEYDMGWRLPWNFNNVSFELCQFLVYVNRIAPDNEHVFLKSTPLSYAVKLLNYLFADKAEYVVTVRHPGAVALTAGTGKEITREDHIQTMAMWANLYSSIIRECRPLGPVTLIQYGEEMTEFLNKQFELHRTGIRLEDTHFFEYEDYDKEFYDSENVQNIFSYVKNSWSLFDLDFRMPEKCI